ncbi:MAG: transglutaminase domain-containing protein [Candidatus Pacebacteria bacterium]|nr:transglutaminase domain-containing protein [Candidatus Paceibacterota bacterium]
MPFSNKEKTTTLESEPKIEGKDFAELEAIKRDLFERIKNDKNGRYAVERVMEHSLKDGVELANFLGYSSREIIENLFSLSRINSVTLKHKDFLANLKKKLIDYRTFLNDDNSHYIHVADEVKVFWTPFNEYSYHPEYEESWQDQIKDGGESGELLFDIDEYYSRFLSLRSFIKEDSLGKGRQIKIEKQKQTETEKVEDAEKSGERVLEWLQKSYEKNYETRLVKTLIWNHLISDGEFNIDVLEEELKKAGVSDESIIKLIYTPLVDFVTLEKIANKIGLDLVSPDTAKKLEKFKWKPYQVAVRGEIGHSKRVLLNSLVDEVETKTDGKKTLVLGEDGQYRIVENIGDREKREGKKEEIDFENPRKEEYCPYERIGTPQEILGKLTFQIEKKDQRFIIHGDKEFGPYEYINNGGKFKEIDDKLTYSIQENGQAYLVHGSERLGPYRSIRYFGEINNKLTFSVWGESVYGEEQNFVFYGSEKLGPYGFVDYIQEINGRLTFGDYQNEDGNYIIYGSEKLGPYDDVGNIQCVEGNLFFKYKKDGLNFIRRGPEIFGPYVYNNISNVQEIDNKLTFIFQKEGKTFIRYGSEEFGPYERTGTPKEISGKLAYEAKINGQWFVIHGTEKFGPYENTGIIGEISDKLTYVAIIKSQRFIIYDNKKFGPYESISDTQEICGKLCFSFIKEGKNYIFYDNKTVFSFYGELKLLKEKENKIILSVWLDQKILTYTFDINKLDSFVQEEFKLTEGEQKRLDLLNVLESIGDKTDMDIISEYFAKYYPNQNTSFLKDSIKQVLSGSYKVKKAITDALKDSPKIFFSTMSAKKDDMSGAYIDHLVFSLFPEIRKNMREQEIKNGYSFGSGGGGDFGRDERGSISPEDNFRGLLSGVSSGGIEGGDPMDERRVEVLKLREGVEGMVATSVYGAYSFYQNKWDKVDFSISEENSGVTKETTFEIPNTYGMKEIVLPKLINSKILTDRIKGIDSDGREILLIGEKNNLREVKVKIPEGVNKILYSQTEDLVPKVPIDISQDEYDRYIRKLDKTYGEKVYESVATMPDEIKLFLISIEDKSPKEKIVEVENFVRKYGYYDFENREVQKEKRGKSISEVFSVMEFRMQEIKRNKPELREQLQDKKYAGVCADFSLLTTAMLRELGIPSGVIIGFRTSPDSLSVNTTQAHAISYAMWPSVDGKTDIITIDGTPNGVTEEEERRLSHIRQHSLKEKEKDIQENSEQILEAAKVKLADFERILEENDVEKIKGLTNGELESVLNTLLGYVKEPHLKIIESVLNAGRYAGFDIKKLSDNSAIDNKVAFYNFMEAEIKRERVSSVETNIDSRFSRGSELMDLVSDFADRYVKDGSSRKESLELLQNVIDITEKNLDSIEKRVATAVIKYLEAVRMKGK